MTLEALIARIRAGAWVDAPDILPLLESIQLRLADPDRAQRIVDKATEVARLWRAQDGVAASRATCLMLDQLVVEVFRGA